jgi:hypothetical protein
MKTNQIIAEFMGVNVITLDDVRKNKNPYFSSADGYLKDNLKYHTSWDWLMPVVDKIEQVHEGVPQELINLSLFSTRDEVYKAVVEFINEYNKRK